MGVRFKQFPNIQSNNEGLREKAIFAEIKPTYRCNQFCPFCIWKSRNKTNEMSKKEIEANFSYIAEIIQPSYIILSGGEPLILPTKELILSSISKIESLKEFHLHTNGTNVSKIEFSLLESVAEKRSATVGIHGHTSAIHDNITGIKGSFDRAIKGINILQDAGYSLRAAVILCRQNFSSIIEITKFLLSINFNIVEIRLPFMNSEKDPRSIFVKYDLLETILSQWKNCFYENPNVLFIASGAICFGKTPLNILNNTEFHFFDKNHQLDAHSISDSQIKSIWHEAYGNYKKIFDCRQCILDTFCPGYSPVEVNFGYAEYNPIVFDNFVD